MARFFEAGASTITLGLGALGFAFGPGTIAAIVRRSANNTLDTALLVGNTAPVRYGLVLTAANEIGLTINDSGSAVAPAGVDSCLAADGWLLIVASKATGTVAPRFSRYEFATGVWQHGNASTTWANSGTPVTKATFGADQAGLNGFAGDIACAAVWDVVLTDAQRESLAASLMAWQAVAPKGLWLLDQATTSQKVLDSTGNGANETANTTATVTAASATLGYGAPIVLVSAATVASITGASDVTLGMTGSAAGTVAVAGASSVALLVTGSAAGTVAVAGDSSATLEITGSATGGVTISGESTATLDAITGSATGAVGIAGASSLTLALEGTAEGTVGVSGESSESLAIDGVSAGVVAVAGASDVTLTMTGSATGTVEDEDTIVGSSSVVLSIEGEATGVVAIAGASDVTLVVTGESSGLVPITGASDVTLWLETASIGAVLVTGGSNATLALASSATGTVSDGVPAVAVHIVDRSRVRLSGDDGSRVRLTGSDATIVRLSGIDVSGERVTVIDRSRRRLSGTSRPLQPS